MRAEEQASDIRLREQAERLDRLREEQDGLKKESVALQRAPARRSRATTKQDETNTRPANAKNGNEESLRWALEDPEMKESFRQYKIESLRQVYGDFFGDCQFSSEQSTRFLDLAFDQESRDTEDAMRFLNGDRDAGKSPLTKEESDQEMRALLGDANFEKYKAYDKTIEERFALTEVREKLSRTTTPLEGDQADTLLQIMMEERGRTPLTAFDQRVSGTSRDRFVAVAQGDNAEQFYRAQTELNQRILSRSGTILSSDQYEALESFLSQYFKMQRISIEMAREVAAQKKGH